MSLPRHLLYDRRYNVCDTVLSSVNVADCNTIIIFQHTEDISGKISVFEEIIYLHRNAMKNHICNK